MSLRLPISFECRSRPYNVDNMRSVLRNTNVLKMIRSETQLGGVRRLNVHEYGA